MNNISTVLPMISIEFDPSAAAPQSEPAESSADDFASMLASMWCAPVTPQQPLPEVVIEPVAGAPTVAVETECSSTPADAPVAGDVMIPQPILTFETSPVAVEPAPVEQVSKKIALPDISLPARKEKIEEESKDTDPIVIEQTTSTVNTQPIMTVAPQPVTQSGKGFARQPIDSVPDPLEAKINIPSRRVPTFVEPTATTSEKEVSIPVPPNAEVIVSVEKNAVDDTSKAAATVVPDQVTAEAIKREANLAASYLAQSTRDNRESTFEAIKAQVSGNSADTSDSSADADTNQKDSTVAMNAGALNFAAAFKKHSIETVKEIAGPQVANQIVDLAVATQPRQQRSVRLRLRPEELGQVDIQLTRDSAGRVSAQVVVEREAARAALTQSLAQLRETLERAGLSVDQLNVSSDASSFAGTARENGKTRDESQRSSLGNETLTNAVETQPKERVREHKLLSLSA